MKNIIKSKAKTVLSLVIAALMLLPLVCCAGKVQPPAGETAQPAASQKPTDTVTARPAGNETPGPEEPSVLPYRIHEPPLTYEEVYNPYTDFDSLRGRTFSMRLMDTEDAYIFSTGLYLYYYDKVTGDSDVLCPKPECRHDYIRQNKECAGFMNAENCYAFCSYMGQIYYIRYYGGANQLCRMNYDTSGREILFALEFGDDPDQIYRYCPEYMAIHRGKLYGWSNQNIVNVGEPKFMWSIVCWDLETGEFSVVFEAEDDAGYPCPFFFGDYVYFTNVKWEYDKKEDGSGLNYTDETVQVWRYDINAGTVEKVFYQSLGTADYGIQQRTFYVAAEDKVYIGGMNDENGTVAVYNLAGGELEEVVSVEADGWIMLFPENFVTCCRNYYKVREDPECPYDIGVWDYEGNALFSGEVPLDIVFDVDEKIDHSDVSFSMPIWDEGGFFIPYLARLDVQPKDYETEPDEVMVLVRYEVADGELQEKLILVNHWPS